MSFERSGHVTSILPHSSLALAEVLGCHAIYRGGGPVPKIRGKTIFVSFRRFDHMALNIIKTALSELNTMA